MIERYDDDGWSRSIGRGDEVPSCPGPGRALRGALESTGRASQGMSWGFQSAGPPSATNPPGESLGQGRESRRTGVALATREPSRVRCDARSRWGPLQPAKPDARGAMKLPEARCGGGPRCQTRVSRVSGQWLHIIILGRLPSSQHSMPYCHDAMDSVGSIHRHSGTLCQGRHQILGTQLPLS